MAVRDEGPAAHQIVSDMWTTSCLGRKCVALWKHEATQDGNMVEQVPAAVADPAPCNSVLPRTSEAGLLGLNAEALDGINHLRNSAPIPYKSSRHCLPETLEKS